MASYYYTIGMFFCSIFLQETLSAKVCGLEKLVPCDVSNKTCILTSLEPQLLQWFKNGRPAYFLDDVNSLFYDEIDIPVKDGVYYLSNVQVLGACNSRLSDFVFNFIDEVKGYINYTYVFNLNVKADSIQKFDENDESITCKRPLNLKMGEVKINIIMPITLVQRCDGTKFMVLNTETLNLKGYPKNCVNYRSGKPTNCDLNDFNEGLIDTVSQLVMRSLNTNYRMIFKLIDFNEFLYIDSDKKQKKQCE